MVAVVVVVDHKVSLLVLHGETVPLIPQGARAVVSRQLCVGMYVHGLGTHLQRRHQTEPGLSLSSLCALCCCCSTKKDICQIVL